MVWWTDEREADLRRLWGEGFSAAWIADVLRAHSRNAVLGKLHRMGLKRPDPKVRRIQGISRRSRTAARIKQEIATMPRQVPQMATHWGLPDPMSECDLMGLTNGRCRYVVTDDPPHRFCGSVGADAAKGVSYCPYHRAMVYRRHGELAEPARPE